MSFLSNKTNFVNDKILVTASGATNFTYTLQHKNITDQIINEFNSIEKFSDKFKLLDEKGIAVHFEKMDHRVFKSNVESYGNSFDRVLGELLLLYYRNNISKNNRLLKFLETLSLSNPIGYDLTTNPEKYYLVMRHFLYDYALGMRAAEVWKQNFQASGGYLVVKEDGNIICYHFYFRNEFELYLLNNTRFETPSTSRHNFGSIYFEEGTYKMKLNLQIRFVT